LRGRERKRWSSRKGRKRETGEWKDTRRTIKEDKGDEGWIREGRRGKTERKDGEIEEGR